MWQLDHKEGWVRKNRCFQIVVLEKTLESPLDCEIKSVNPKGNQPWIFIGRPDAEAEVSTLWPPDVKSWLTAKDPDAGKNWGHEEKGATVDEMVEWHQWLNGHEFEQTPGDSKGQGSLHAAVHRVAKSWTWLNNSNNKTWCNLVFACSFQCPSNAELLSHLQVFASLSSLSRTLCPSLIFHWADYHSSFWCPLKCLCLCESLDTPNWVSCPIIML